MTITEFIDTLDEIFDAQPCIVEYWDANTGRWLMSDDRPMYMEAKIEYGQQ